MSMRSPRALLAIVFLSYACGGDGIGTVPNPAETPASIVLALSSTDDMTSTGDLRAVTAVVKDASQQVVSRPSLSWTTSAPSVATVSPSGTDATITAVNDGTAVITATIGNVRETVTVTVHRRLVALEASTTDSVIAVGTSVPLNVTGRDARNHAIYGLTGVTYRTSNAGSVIVSPSGSVTALFSAVGPLSANITATITRDGLTLNATQHFKVGPTAPPVFQFSSYMIPEAVLPEPVFDGLLGESVVYFTLDGPSIKYKLLWSYLSGAPVSAHIHISPDSDPAADLLVDLPLGNEPSRHGIVSGSFSAADIRAQGNKPPISLDSLTALMRIFGTYVDLHTTRHPGGEVGNLVYYRP